MATYTVTNTFTADTTAVASEVNQNFTDVLTALNAFDASNLASGTVPLARISGLTVAQLAASTLVTEAEGIESNDNDTTLATCAAVKDAYDTAITAAESGFIKAWVNFDGDDGTVADSFNVFSVTRTGVGAYTIVWDSFFPDANYAIAGFLADLGLPAGVVANGATDTPLSANQALIQTHRVDGAAADYNLVTIMAIGN